jgi:uncharacterized protein YjdB
MKKIFFQTIVLNLLLTASSMLNAQSPYIHKVYDFMPAPGQFTNDMPEYTPGDTKADMVRKVEEAIANNNQGMISLGGYGGYVVFGFDHEVENKPGKYDFKVLGNAFYAAANPNGDASKEGGSCEPGIVMVSYDANGNGLPDDAWYELAGSEYNKPPTVKHYQITYQKPDENKLPVPHPTYPYLNNIEYIRWTTNGHGDGYLYRNVYHNQSYYPQWITDETLTFEGTKLANNAVDESGNGSYYVLYAYQWGYADNHPNSDNRSGFNIEWAVDANGNRVNLPGIHFVKVYTGVNQYCGWIGETSTEILGAEDLHLTGRDADVPVFVAGISLDRTSVELQPDASLELIASITPADATNKKITWKSDAPTIASVDDTGKVTAGADGTAVIQAITNDGYHIASCTVTVTSKTGIDATNGNEAQVRYAFGELHLCNLEGYACSVVSISGQTINMFKVAAPDERRMLHLPQGIYILTAQKPDHRKIVMGTSKNPILFSIHILNSFF